MWSYPRNWGELCPSVAIFTCFDFQETSVLAPKAKQNCRELHPHYRSRYRQYIHAPCPFVLSCGRLPKLYPRIGLYRQGSRLLSKVRQ